MLNSPLILCLLYGAGHQFHSFAGFCVPPLDLTAGSGLRTGEVWASFLQIHGIQLPL
jgi:hypothetical protein